MAFTYKSIGNTASAVVSLLAVGTALWFNRTPGPIDAPRPQDEAEIMTAILERHYAMGRTDTQFTQTRAAYVSSVPDTNVVGGVRYVTNSAAYTLTNTIGFFPNATFEYPDLARTSLNKGYDDGTDYIRSYDGYKYWLAPSNSFYSHGSMDLNDIISFQYLPSNVLYDAGNICSVNDVQWWTNRVTLPIQVLLSSSAIESISTNGTNRSVVIAASTNAYDSYTNGLKFAFERDNKPYFWSTNAYNDIARCLAAQQFHLATGVRKKPFGVTITVSIIEGPSTPRLQTTNFVWSIGGTGVGEAFELRRYTDPGYKTNMHLTWIMSSMICSITNDTPFVFTNGITFMSWDSPTYNLYTNNYGPYPTNMHSFLTKTNYFFRRRATEVSRTSLLDSGWSIPPGGEHSYTMGHTSNEACEIAVTLGDIALREFNALLSGDDRWTGKTYFWRNSDTEAIRGIPCYGASSPVIRFSEIELDSPVVYYKILFSALTNYLDHAPAR